MKKKVQKIPFTPKSEVIVSIVFSALFLLLLHLFYDDIAFLTSDFSQILPLYTASLLLGIMLPIPKLFVQSSLYELASEGIQNLLFILIAYQLWVIFPFNTSAIGNANLWNGIFHVLIIVPPLLTIIASSIKCKAILETMTSRNSA